MRKMERKSNLNNDNNEYSDIPTDEDDLDAFFQDASGDSDNENKAPEARLFWSKHKIKVLMINFWRFGWGRWNSIITNCELTCTQIELKLVCRILITWLIESCSEQFPLVENLIKVDKDPSENDLEIDFIKKYKDNLFQLVTNGAKWKLDRIELLYFLNTIVLTCPNPPSEILVPNLQSKPTTWWTEEDDQALIHGTFLYGYHQFQKLIFSNENEKPQGKILSSRIRQIINNFKQIYMKYKDQKGKDLPFSHQTLKAAQSVWSKRLHHKVVSLLLNYGLETPERMKEILASDKSIDSINIYVQEVIRISKIVFSNSKEVIDDQGNKSDDISEDKTESEEKNENISEIDNLGILTEPIGPGQASRILSRIDLFEKLRESLKTKDFNENDLKFLQYISLNGLNKLSESDYIKEIFGTEALEKKVVKRIKKLSNSKINIKPTVITQTLNARIKRDLNGKPILPLTNGPSLTIVSLGEIVYDREEFHNSRYIYPAGYISERQYFSIINPDEKCWYRANILDRGESFPIFKVELKSDPSIFFEGNSPSSPWSSIVRTVEKKRKELNIISSSKPLAISGPEYYGLASNVVQQLISELENVEKCKKYQRILVDQTKSNKRNIKNDESDNENNELIEKNNILRKQTIVIDFPKILKRARERNLNYL